jgi:hypothetical protein
MMRMAASAPVEATSSTSAPRLMRASASEPESLFTKTAGATASAAATPSAAAAGGKPDPAPTAERSQWDRIALTNDIELHVRRPLSRLDHRRVERLITIARPVLGEEKP